MLKTKSLQTVCLSCRLNIAITRARNARLPSQAQLAPQKSRTFTNTQPWTQRRAISTTAIRRQLNQEQTPPPEDPPASSTEQVNIEVNARNARQQFGDALPRGHLTEAEFKVYRRLYGDPLLVDTIEELQEPEVEEEEIIEEEQPDGSVVLLRKGKDGELEEIDVIAEDELLDEGVDEFLEEEKEDQLEEEEPSENTMTPEEWEAHKEEKAQKYHDEVYEQSRLVQERSGEWEDIDEAEEDNDFMRAHPLTIAGRFKPSPSTVFLPKETMVDPTALLLTRANHKHLAETSNRIFGGRGLPQSASTPPARLQLAQKPMPLNPSQGDMGNIEADAYMAAVQPGTYATVMSTLVETRRRLGSSWLEHLLQDKKGGMILDAGSGGVGVLAWHEILQAEWQRMHEDSSNTSQGAAPLGKATVLTGSDTLRHRASKLLENTTFIPRLPDNLTAEEEANQQQPRKMYDVIIAPHTLWPIKFEYLRKESMVMFECIPYGKIMEVKNGETAFANRGDYYNVATVLKW